MNNRNINARVVITGANGMLGSYLVSHLLSLGYTNIVCVVRSSERCGLMERIANIYGMSSLLNRVQLVEGEPSDYHFLKSVICRGDIVYALAARVGFSPNDTSIIADNVSLATVTADVCSEQQIAVVVYVSSIATLQPTENSTEKSIPISINIKTKYSQSKFYSEGEFWRVYYGGTPVVIVNPSVILGVGEWSSEGSPKIFRQLAKGRLFSTAGSTGFVGARDVAAVMELLSLRGEAIGQRYIINSQNLQYSNLSSMIASEFDVRTPKIVLPNSILKLICRVVSLLERIGIHPSISSESIRGLASSDGYNNNKVTTLLGYQFEPIDSVVRECVRHYKKIFH